MRSRIIAVVCAVIGFGNFVVYTIISMIIGGTAANGVIRDGHHLVCDHGKCSEVSALTYRLSLLHGRSVMFTLPIGAIGVAWLASIRKKDDEYSSIGHNPT